MKAGTANRFQVLRMPAAIAVIEISRIYGKVMRSMSAVSVELGRLIDEARGEHRDQQRRRDHADQR